MPSQTLLKNKCLCGCGTRVMAGKKYVLGHNSRTVNPWSGRGTRWKCGVKKGNVPWNRGLKKETDKRVMDATRAQSAVRKGKSWKEMFGEEIAKRITENRKSKGQSKESNLKRSRSAKELFRDPEYIKRREKSSFSNKRFVRGVFKSYKNCCDIHFQSSYELYAFIKLEHDDNIKSYGRCRIPIPYVLHGEMRTYIPDLGVQYVNGDFVIIEIKPLSLVWQEINVEKILACQNYCRANNMVHIVWTEKDIFN